MTSPKISTVRPERMKREVQYEEHSDEVSEELGKRLS